METNKTRGRWALIASIPVALIAGIGIGAAGNDIDSIEDPAEQLDVEPMPVETVEVGTECQDYAAWVLMQTERMNEISDTAFDEMADILDRDGYLVTAEYIDIVGRATVEFNALADELELSNSFDCF